MKSFLDMKEEFFETYRKYEKEKKEIKMNYSKKLLLTLKALERLIFLIEGMIPFAISDEQTKFLSDYKDMFQANYNKLNEKGPGNFLFLKKIHSSLISFNPAFAGMRSDLGLV